MSGSRRTKSGAGAGAGSGVAAVQEAEVEIEINYKPRVAMLRLACPEGSFPNGFYIQPTVLKIQGIGKTQQGKFYTCSREFVDLNLKALVVGQLMSLHYKNIEPTLANGFEYSDKAFWRPVLRAFRNQLQDYGLTVSDERTDVLSYFKSVLVEDVLNTFPPSPKGVCKFKYSEDGRGIAVPRTEASDSEKIVYIFRRLEVLFSLSRMLKKVSNLKSNATDEFIELDPELEPLKTLSEFAYKHYLEMFKQLHEKLSLSHFAWKPKALRERAEHKAYIEAVRSFNAGDLKILFQEGANPSEIIESSFMPPLEHSNVYDGPAFVLLSINYKLKNLKDNKLKCFILMLKAGASLNLGTRNFLLHSLLCFFKGLEGQSDYLGETPPVLSFSEQLVEVGNRTSNLDDFLRGFCKLCNKFYAESIGHRYHLRQAFKAIKKILREFHKELEALNTEYKLSIERDLYVLSVYETHIDNTACFSETKSLRQSGEIVNNILNLTNELLFNTDDQVFTPGKSQLDILHDIEAKFCELIQSEDHSDKDKAKQFAVTVYNQANIKLSGFSKLKRVIFPADDKPETIDHSLPLAVYALLNACLQYAIKVAGKTALPANVERFFEYVTLRHLKYCLNFHAEDSLYQNHVGHMLVFAENGLIWKKHTHTYVVQDTEEALIDEPSVSSPLWLAIMHKDLELVTALLDLGFDLGYTVETQFKKTNALFVLCEIFLKVDEVDVDTLAILNLLREEGLVITEDDKKYLNATFGQQKCIKLRNIFMENGFAAEGDDFSSFWTLYSFDQLVEDDSCSSDDDSGSGLPMEAAPSGSIARDLLGFCGTDDGDGDSALLLAATHHDRAAGGCGGVEETKEDAGSTP